MIDRLVNIFFIFSLIFIFLLFANAEDHIRIGLALILATLFSILAFILNWLTLDGMKSAILFGLIAYGLGSSLGAFIVLAFFISSSLLSKDLIGENLVLDKKFRRDGLQVWSNGFWFAFWIIIWFLSKEDAFLIAGVASMASATADTWASEIGEQHVKGKTWLFPSFKAVEPGVDGGISIVGTIASLTGAAFIGGVFWLISPDAQLYQFLIIAISGVFGSLLDSFFGSIVQGNKISKFLKTIILNQFDRVDNNMVNWMAAGGASFVALLAVLLI